MADDQMRSNLASTCPSDSKDETMQCHFDGMQINISIEAIDKLKEAIKSNDPETV